MRIGLCLSGGGARGIYHIGVLKAIQEKKININICSATSVGALMASLYFGGLNADQILQMAKDTRWFDFIRPSIPSKGLVDLDYLKKILEDKLSVKTFEQLKIPCKFAATNISTGKLVIFDKGDFIQPVLASCSVPMLFKPIMINNELYLDGGILMNMPSSIIRDHCDLLIGVSLLPIDVLSNKELNSGLKVLSRVLELSVHHSCINQNQLCDILIESPELSRFSKYDLREMNSLAEMGYETALKALEKL